MKVLINPLVKVRDVDGNILGSKVEYYYDEVFEVAQPFFFVDNADITLESGDPQFFYYKDDTGEIIKYIRPEPVIIPAAPVAPQKTMEQLIEEAVAAKLAEMLAANSTSNTSPDTTSP